MSDNLSTDITIDNNLIHFFYVIGLNPTIILNDSFYQNIKAINTLDSLKPSILTKFPPITNSILNLNDEILLRHCFPNGYYITTSNSAPSPESFFLEFNNYPLQNKFNKVYYTCLLFYENLEYYNQIKVKKKLYDKSLNKSNISHNNNKDDSIEISDSMSFDLVLDDDYSNYYIPKVIAFASVLPYPRELSKILLSLYNNYSVSKKDITMPIEKIIENFIFGIPIPPKGIFVIAYKIFNEKYYFHQSPINKIPNNSIELQILFNKFKVPDVLKIYKCLLLEIPLLFFSNHKTRLTSFIEGIVSLLYPFKYQRPKISILPTNHYSIIEMSTSFALGINQEYKPNFFIENNLEVENKTIIIVDIDKINITEHKADFKSYPNLFLDDIGAIDQVEYIQNLYNATDIPLHYKKKLMSRLVAYLNKLKEQVNHPEDKETFNAVIREEFFYFLLSIFTDISKYIKLDIADLSLLDKGLNDKKSTIDINTIFKVREFLMTVTGENMPFFKRFCDTEIFKQYIIGKIYPKTPEERLEALFFDEKIIEKRNKNLFSKTTKTPLLDFKELNNQNVTEIKRPKDFTLEEMAVLSRKERCALALSYYQMITADIANNGKVIIKYPVFPMLLYDNVFFDKDYSEIYLRNNISLPVNLKIELNKTFDYLVNQPEYNEIYQGSKYNLKLFSLSKALSVSMEDYISLTWLMFFALSYWYNDKDEKAFRFIEMLEVFDKLDYYDEEVLSLVYFSLIANGEDSQVIKLYEMIAKCKSMNNYEMFSYLCIKIAKSFNMKTAKRINTISSRMTLLMREAEESASASVSQDGIKFNKRSLLSHGQSQNANESINFNTEVLCEYCNKNNELNFLSLLEKKCDSIDAVWLCYHCKQRIKPKLKVQINQDKLKSFEVLTPYDLFTYCRSKFMTSNKYKIDIESFRTRHSSVFFNCLLYFSMRNLSFDFLIPYQKKTQSQNQGMSEGIVTVIDEGNNVNPFSNLEIASNLTDIHIDSSKNERERDVVVLTKVKTMQSKCIVKQRVKKKGNNSMDFDSLMLNKIKLNTKEEPIVLFKQKSERKLTLDFQL